MMEDPSTLARILAEGDGDHATEGHRLFCDGAVVDGRWQVLALLGKGGNGEVYRVCDIKAGTIGALKVPCAEENKLRRRFDRELEILQQIATLPLSEASRHFPRIIDRGMVAEKDIPYFVIEFLQAIKIPKKNSAVKKLVLEVSEAVRELHKNGYLHRDIKLANLMQRENGDVVLIDFGLVGRIEDFENPLAERVSMTQGGRMTGVGTEGSTAPEQLYGHASVRSDIYAIASVAVDCFGGELPRMWIPIIQKAHNPKEEHRFDGIDDFVSAVKRDVPEREWRSSVRLLAIALSIVGVCSMLAYYYVQRKTSDGNNPKQGQETWEEFVSRRVQEDRPEIEESLKELRAHMAELKRETEDIRNDSAEFATPSEPPLTLSKLLLTRKLKNNGLYEKFEEFLDEHDLRVEWDVAQKLRTDDPVFKRWKKDVQVVLGLNDESAKQFILDSVIVEDQMSKSLVLSKLKLIRLLKSKSLHEKFLRWLDENSMREEWDAARELRTDHPMFKQGVKSVQSALDLDDASMHKLIVDSVIDD